LHSARRPRPSLPRRKDRAENRHARQAC
jgi:hypothetical protein